METYQIPEENLSKLESKLNRIKKKCDKNQINFHYEQVGEAYLPVDPTDPDGPITKFITVEVEGQVKYNGWEFVATLEHLPEGNIVRSFNPELVVPEKYYTCGPKCEHCNKIRSRKDTYLIYNAENEEYKQVGKTCLKEFTSGLDAEQVAFFLQFFSSLEASEDFGPSPSYVSYYTLEEVLHHAFECFHHWGYERVDEFDPGSKTTKGRVARYIHCPSGFDREEMDEVGYDENSEYAISNTEAALDWIRNVPEDDLGFGYLRNLYTLCKQEYITGRDFGIVCSLTTAYFREVERQKVKAAKEAEAKVEAEKSSYQGEIGDRLDVRCELVQCVSSWESQFGWTYLYKIIDTEGNIYIWYASRGIDEPENVVAIKGTVKDHSEFNGVKQTVLTRCKVTDTK